MLRVVGLRALGLKAGWQAWRHRGDADADEPVGTGGLAVVFLLLVGVWVLAGRYFAARPVVARALSRWGHVVLPVVLVGLGLLILSGGW